MCTNTNLCMINNERAVPNTDTNPKAKTNRNVQKYKPVHDQR